MSQSTKRKEEIEDDLKHNKRLKKEYSILDSNNNNQSSETTISKIEIPFGCIIHTEDRWNTLCSLLDKKSFDWKSFALIVNFSIEIAADGGSRSRELLYHLRNDSNTTTSKVVEILRTQNQDDAISLIQSWITECENLDPMVLYEQAMEYYWKKNFHYMIHNYAILFFQKAANNNYPPSYLILAAAHGIMENKDECKKYKELCAACKGWFMEHALTGDPKSQYHMALYLDCIEDDATESFEWLQKSANQGYLPAQNDLGIYFDTGEGVIKDDIQAFNWYQKAAEQGFMRAQFHVAVCYENGTGVQKDEVKAFCWYQKAAEQGNTAAQYNLAILYEDGSGVQKDEVKAMYWYQKAAEQGDSDGQYTLATHYQDGTGVQKDGDKAVYWYQKAAEQGDNGAQTRLGWCYYNGYGVKQDYSMAVHWFKKCEGTAGLARCYEYGEGVAQDLNKAISLYKRADEWNHVKRMRQVTKIQKCCKEESD